MQVVNESIRFNGKLVMESNEELKAEIERLKHLVNWYKTGLLLIHENVYPSNAWMIADKALNGVFNPKEKIYEHPPEG